jgi:hypothetical protein
MPNKHTSELDTLPNVQESGAQMTKKKTRDEEDQNRGEEDIRIGLGSIEGEHSRRIHHGTERR